MALISLRWWAALAWAAVAAAIGCGDNLGSPGGGDCVACVADGGTDGVDSGACACDAGLSGAAAYCDDGNPCTVDSVDGEDCRFDQAEDGALCQDGDFCTLGDQCRSGECVAGARAEGELALLGDLENLSGRRVRLGANRFVVVTREDLFRGRIQVVARTGDQLATLSSWKGELILPVLGDDEILADAIETTGIVAVTDLGGRTLRLFSASDSKVAALGQVELSSQVLSLDGHGDRLWLCTGNFVTGYAVTLVDIAHPRRPREVGAMPLGYTSCGSVAISQDGRRVYVNTADGVRFVDAAPLDTGGDPTLSDVIAPAAGVAISGSGLLLLGTNAVRILREPELDQLASVPVAGPRAATLFGDRLLVEGVRDLGGHNEHVVSWYDALGGAPALLDELVFYTSVGEPTTRSYRSATDGTTLFTSAHAFDVTGDRIEALRMPELVSLATLRRATPSGVRAYHPGAAALIDVSAPSAPAFAAGGSFSSPQPGYSIALDDSLPAPAFATGLAGGYDDSGRVVVDKYAQPGPVAIHRWTLDGAADLVSDEATAVDPDGGGTIHLLAAGDFIYRFDRQLLAPDSTTSFLAFWLPALHGTTPAAPIFDLPLTATPPGNFSALRSFDVDPRARIAVLSSEARSSSGSLAPALLFHDLSTSPPTHLGTLPTDQIYAQVRISGTRVVAANYGTIAFFDLQEGALTSITSDAAVSIEQLLAFDGETAYIGELVINPGDVRYYVSAYPFDSPTPVRVEVDAIARSLAPTATGLAVGFETELRVIHPHCPSP